MQVRAAMIREKARKLLSQVERHYRTWRTEKWSGFVFGPLSEAVRRLDEPGSSRRDLGLAATGYAFMGDVWDFLDAPRAAARAYRAAVRCDPEDAWSWRELGGALNDVGHYRAALRALRVAESLGDTDDLLEWYLEEATDAVGNKDRWRRYRNGCVPFRPAPSWKVSEFLARNMPRAALKLLQRKRHPYLRQLRARACGAAGDVPGLIAEWEGVARTEGEVEIEFADWFFLPEQAWDESGFWRALYALRRRLGYGWSYVPESLWQVIPSCGGFAGQKRNRRRLSLWFLYQIARIEGDWEAAHDLASSYPGFQEAVCLASRLKPSRR